MQYFTDYNLQILVIVALAFSLFSVFYVMPKFGLFAGALFGYMGLNAIWVWLYQHNRYEFLCVSDPKKPGCILDENGHPMLDAYTQQALHFSAIDSFLKAMVILVPLMLFIDRDPHGYKRAGKIIFGWICALNSLAIAVSYILGYCEKENSCGGFIGNPSLSVSFMVCAMPFFTRGRERLLLLPIAIAVILSRSSIGFGLLAVFVFFFLFLKRNRVAKLTALSLLFLAPLAGYLLLGNELWFTSGRALIWKMMLRYWHANPGNWAFGTGWGTYRVFSINLEDHAGYAVNSWSRWWSWLHNDWLENFLFETGIVGLILAIQTYTVAMLKTLLRPFYLKDKRGDVALSLLLYGIFMALDPALHYPVPMIFGAWLFVLALRREPLQFEPDAS